MLQLIQNNLDITPKALYCLVFDNIKNGIELNEKEYNCWLKIKPKLGASYFILIKDGCILYYKNGAKVYYKHGKRHRDDGPAAEWLTGRKEYWINGKPVFRLE